MSTDQTPALTRATEALNRAFDEEPRTALADLDEPTRLLLAEGARDAVSAALHDPDDAIVEALRTEFAYRMRTSATRARLLRQKVADEDIANAAAAALAKVRAAILGEAS